MALAQLDATCVVPDGIGDEQRVFGFEADFADDLRCIPMVGYIFCNRNTQRIICCIAIKIQDGLNL